MANKGIPLMEVFNITYLGNVELDAEDQLGTIITMSSMGFQYLYDVPEFEITMPSLKTGDLIFTTEDIHPTLYCPHFFIEFDLFSGLFKETIPIDWDSHLFEVTDHVRRIPALDLPIYSSGDIVFHYGLFTNATVAHISVKLLDLPITFAAVSGFVAASNSEFIDLPFCASMLFVKDAENEVFTEFDRSIPLSKSRVAVPLDSTLCVHISLNYYDERNYNAQLYFDAETKGIKVKHDDSGLIQVTVTWTADVHSIKSTYESRESRR